MSKSKIIKLICAFILIPTLFGYFSAFLNILSELIELRTFEHKMFMLGIIIYFPVYFISIRKFRFLQTLEHEFTHILFAKLFLKNTNKLIVTSSQGGLVELTGSNFIIALSPYFFPTLSFIWFAIGFIIRQELFVIIVTIIGVTFSNHVVSSIKEIRFRQSDIKKHGYLFSIIFILTASTIFNGILLSLTLHDSSSLINFLVSGFEYSKYWYVKFI